jgi:hypothetical protein
MIRNKQGSDCIGRKYSDKFKNRTKSSVITTKNGISIALYYTKSNIHNINTVENTIYNSIFKLNNKKFDLKINHINQFYFFLYIPTDFINVFFIKYVLYLDLKINDTN